MGLREDDAHEPPRASLNAERNPVFGVPDVVLRVQVKSIGARILMGLASVVIFALLVYWGYASHDLPVTIVTLVVVGAVVVASQVARRRRE